MSLAHYRSADVVGLMPGYSTNVLISPVSFFDNLAAPTDGNLIIGQHTFLNAGDFLTCYCLPKTIELPSEGTGEQGAVTAIWKPQFFIPGDGPETLAFVEALLNQELVALFRDPTTPEMVQIGTARNPMFFEKASFESGTMFEGIKGYRITGISTEKNFYNYDGGIFDFIFDNPPFDTGFN